MNPNFASFVAGMTIVIALVNLMIRLIEFFNKDNKK